MRLFAAVVPPDPVAGELAAAVAALREIPGADRLRWTHRHGWHLTLAFFGEVAAEPLPGLHRRLARAAHRHPPFELGLSGAGRFGQRALWAGVRGDTAGISRLAATAVAAGRRAGLVLPDEPPRFTPHLTLARTRNSAPVDLRPFAGALAGFTGSAWTVPALELIRSHPPAPGVPGAQPHYETVALWPLGGPAPPAEGSQTPGPPAPGSPSPGPPAPGTPSPAPSSPVSPP
ncbi:RNA 2',3'-cyclic phosphodiesterase [Streptomyces zingiberis]|uniref:RNA 2',3'-cyclic phosphodiesterase n=1 Tax=Streptomyces zingiberis TaxID=2053010 RepID=A0ABX1BQF7_9ACTN|nr:RNA 2',3'-cyclic phosphodiesterase [Streptomyces zingiberis]NJP99956.1 RNA 2',3'-cyclic phosphodiesterase [Streptomyces zingiberis]